jgi:SAM-dependent methyltransferase
MNFTGERYIPGQGGFQIAYEHRHRYLFALRWAEGKRVLDLACGSGYGASLLARRARHVWALDLDEPTIRGAQKDCGRHTVGFIQGDATQLPFRDRSMELIVAMEALEHIRDQKALLREMARVCAASGVALISTPNKAVYSDARQYTNPFHLRELYLEEFVRLLEEHFPHVQVAGQQIRAGSLLSCNADTRLHEVISEAASGAEEPAPEPMYFLAICSMEELLPPSPAYSAYLDSADGLILEGKQETDRLNEEIDTLGRWAKTLEDAIEKRDREIQDLQVEMAGAIQLRDQTIRSLQDEMKEEIARRDQQFHRLEKEFDERGKWALSLQEEVEHLVRIRRAFLYRILSRIGFLPK